MGLLDKLKFQAWDEVAAVVSLIHKWKPDHAQGRTRADLCVAGKVIVELKNDLDTTGKYQRLVGQLAEYKQWDGRVVVLLTGTTDPNLRKQLDRYLSDEGLSGGYTLMDLAAKVTVVQK